MLILGIDTSCDDTSCAVVENGTKILSNVVSSQTDIHSKYGGVVPEIASRRHIEMMVPVTERCLAEAGIELSDINAVSVTHGPGLIGALLVGTSFAKSLAYTLGVPLVPVHHLVGHIYANFLRGDQPAFPVLNLVVSGGHSELILMKDHGQFDIISQTLDDAAGEVFDKVARELGLPFPGGPHLDEVAEMGDPESIFFPLPKIQGVKHAYSFSGIKTRAILEFEARGRGEEVIPDLCASFRKAVVEQLLHPVDEIMKDMRANSFAISGGVAANRLLRKEANLLCDRLGVPLYIPPIELCTDNGAMISAAGFFKYHRTGSDIADWLYLSPSAGLELESWRESN